MHNISQLICLIVFLVLVATSVGRSFNAPGRPGGTGRPGRPGGTSRPVTSHPVVPGGVSSTRPSGPDRTTTTRRTPIISSIFYDSRTGK